MYRYGTLMKYILEKLAIKGVKVQPYYLVREQLLESIRSEFEIGYDDYKYSFLGPEDMKVISQCRNWNRPPAYYVNLLNRNQKCFGIKYKGQLVAFTWIDLNKCNFLGENFFLNNNEAYFYDAWTLKEYRGKKIASFMRYQCYRALNQMGKDSFFSISEFFNPPAQKFKERLGAKNMKLGIFFELFQKYRWTWNLKAYG